MSAPQTLQCAQSVRISDCNLRAGCPHLRLQSARRVPASQIAICAQGGLLDKPGGRTIVFGVNDELMGRESRSIPRDDVAEARSYLKLLELT